MPPKTILSEWQRHRVRKLMVEGVPLVEIARRFGVTPQLLNYWRKKWSQNESTAFKTEDGTDGRQDSRE